MRVGDPMSIIYPSPQIPDIRALTSVILHPHESPFSVPLQHKPLYWKLHEHHCLRSDESLSSGVGDADDDDFLNAWLPRGILVKYLDVSDPYFLTTVVRFICFGRGELKSLTPSQE
jgi:hypothetical protein